MFERNERVRCVSNDWNAHKSVHEHFILEHVPRIGGEYTIQGVIPPGEYLFAGGYALRMPREMVRLNELASPLDIAGVDGFPAHWFRRAVKFDTSASMQMFRDLATNPRIPIPSET